MQNTSTHVVLGASGTIGQALCTALVARGLPVRAVWRTRPVTAHGLESVQADVTTSEGLAQALKNARSLFLLTGDMPAQTEVELRIVDAAARAGLAHLVKLSTWGAQDGAFSIARIHRPVELAIKVSGLAYTLLRPNCFMQNFVTYYRHALQGSGVLQLPCGAAPVSFIDAHDIAQVAAAVLAAPQHHVGAVYALSGPQALTHAEAVALLAQASGRPLRYATVSKDQYQAQMAQWDVPASVTRDVVELCASYDRGEASQVLPTVAQITGRQANAFDRFAAEHAGLLR